MLVKLGGDRISNQKFAQFLKFKVDKKSEMETLVELTELIDLDCDQFITEQDLQTCVSNLQTSSFWSGKQSVKLTASKASEIIQQIHQAIGKNKTSFRAVFDSFDTNKDNMVSLAEFKRGI